MISVIVPVYNSEKLLPRCLESICNQTYKNLEILIIDDGSTDSSGIIADGYVEKDARVRVFHQENMGVSAARNKGLREAKGDFIAFVDSDDYIRPYMYEKLITVLLKYHVDIVTSDFTIDENVFVNSMESERIYSKDEIISKILPSFTYENTLGNMEFKNKLMRADFIRTNGIHFYEEFSFQEDLMFMINIYAYAKSLYYLPEVFYEYYPLSGGLYSSYRKNGGEKFIAAREIMISLIGQYHIPNIDYHNFNNAFLYNISFYIYRTLNYIHNKKEQSDLIKATLQSETVISCCRELVNTATSFDRRIAKAISSGDQRRAIALIKFVYSGKAGKLQKVLGKIKRG